ncbi:amidase signature enzyme [Schizopora paradoxa]|uniref:amidase n=1 Tax=Schizopora paradoxa TaxID=27342 RepID=A0A0H2S1W0_9AGAM|nr:amidase signature enzyme [Schizopora paradoxa]
MQRASPHSFRSLANALTLFILATEIVRKIQAGEWTARSVVAAFIRQAIRAHEATNCLTEVRFDDALKEAAELDAEFAKTKILKGPLHGVPVSFKDQYDIAGLDSSIGFTQWAYKPQSEDALLVKQFKGAGAIIIAKTNVPQTMLSFECCNPLWGRTTNPYSPEHTPGGSSGGEAALLACSGSAIGIGSDTGGSLRIPASYCGIYSLKPGWGRLSMFGAASPSPGAESIPTVAGPMTRSWEDIDLMCRTFFGSPPAEHELQTAIPYREVTLPEKLKFGYYTSDLMVKASPACKRAVIETVEALKRQGHECVEFESPIMFEAMCLFTGLTSADGYKTLSSHLGPDPREDSLFLVTLGPSVPSFIRGLGCWVASNILGDKTYATCLDNSRVKSVKEYYKYVAQRDELRRRWYDEVWKRYGLDGIIAPVQASPALPHGATKTLAPLAAGTILYNVIDSPVGVVPVTRVDPAKDGLTDEWSKGPGLGSKLIESDVYRRKKNLAYDPEAMKGLPVGVQVVGKSWEDEKVVAMMKVVDDALGPRGFGPDAWQDRIVQK